MICLRIWKRYYVLYNKKILYKIEKLKQKFTPASIELLKAYLWAKTEPTEIEERLLNIADKHIQKLKSISGIHMIWICNSISMNASHEDSDIDLFIITSPHRLWYVRAMVTLYFQVRGLRKTGKKHAGRFCLSFFCTTEWINFKRFALKDDIYLYYWILAMKPIVNNNRCYQKYVEANNQWADYMQFKNSFSKHQRNIPYTWEVDWENNKTLNILDNICKKILLPKTLKSFKKLWYPFWVIISDTMLKFHDQDRRKQIKKDLWYTS